MDPSTLSIVQIVGVLVVLYIIWSVLRSFIKLTQEYERGVVFRLGRVTGAPRGPGLILVIPFVERVQRIDLRTVTTSVPPQECITSDNVTVRLDAVVYFRVSDPIKAIVRIRDYTQATLQIAQTSLRSVIGQVELDQLLSHRDAVNSRLREIIDKQTLAWGIDVSVVEVRDVQLPDSMQRAMAKQAEAEREKRAKLILADAEFLSAGKLQEAAALMSSEPGALQLRYLQTLTQISEEKTTIILYDTSSLNLTLNRLADAVGLGNLNAATISALNAQAANSQPQAVKPPVAPVAAQLPSPPVHS